MLTAESDQLPYAGNLSAEQAWDVLTREPDSQLIDVRTLPEWQFAGLPDLREIGKDVITVPYRIYPTMEVNSAFAQQVQDALPGAVQPDTTLLFLCKVGGRSLDAAITLTQLGFTACYNIEDGFEGAKNAQEQRGTVSGWKAASLPWRSQ